MDDEPWFHEPLRYALEAKGYECLFVTDMSLALETLERSQVSVVVTDIMMPAGKDYPNLDSQETGFHLIQKVRANWPQTGVVCLSVIGDQSKIRPLRAYKIDYLRKGEVPLATVVQTIERAAGEGGQKVWRF
ncbi:MAG TPA: response regulator [Candidatus Acidoferrales bacterium]|nr:response regulator [Candidatus Acidoferrales bacterium]